MALQACNSKKQAITPKEQRLRSGLDNMLPPCAHYAIAPWLSNGLKQVKN
jgi:hypothetical protein